MGYGRNSGKYEIRWRPDEGESQLYGSRVIFQKSGSVSVDGPLIPSGTVIHRWASHRDYGREQKLADLPLLEKGALYRITLNVRSNPAETVCLRLNWFNRFQELVESRVIHSAETIAYPGDGDSYTAELIWAGAEQCVFDCICIEKEKGGS